MTTNREQVARWCAHESGDECPAGNEYLDCLANQEIRWRCRCSEYDALLLAAIKDKLREMGCDYFCRYHSLHKKHIVEIDPIYGDYCEGYEPEELDAYMNAVLAMGIAEVEQECE